MLLRRAQRYGTPHRSSWLQVLCSDDGEGPLMLLLSGWCLAVQMVLETKAGLESGVIGAGHRFAASRLDAQRSTAGWVSEQMGGLSYLSFIRQLLSRVEGEWDSVKARPPSLLVLPPSAIYPGPQRLSFRGFASEEASRALDEGQHHG